MHDLGKIAQTLTIEAFEGITHVDISRGLASMDPELVDRAPVFFQQL